MDRDDEKGGKGEADGTGREERRVESERELRREAGREDRTVSEEQTEEEADTAQTSQQLHHFSCSSVPSAV